MLALGLSPQQVDLHLLVAADHYNVLDDTGGELPRDTRQFETVPVQVNRMNVVARIPHAQSVPAALLPRRYSGRMLSSANGISLIVHWLKPPAAAFCFAKVMSIT